MDASAVWMQFCLSRWIHRAIKNLEQVSFAIFQNILFQLDIRIEPGAALGSPSKSLRCDAMRAPKRPQRNALGSGFKSIPLPSESRLSQVALWSSYFRTADLSVMLPSCRSRFCGTLSGYVGYRRFKDSSIFAKSKLPTYPSLLIQLLFRTLPIPGMYRESSGWPSACAWLLATDKGQIGRSMCSIWDDNGCTGLALIIGRRDSCLVSFRGTSFQEFCLLSSVSVV